MTTIKSTTLHQRGAGIQVPELPVVDESKNKGFKLFPTLYSSIFICSRKMTGKSTLIYNILKGCVDARTKVIIFSSTYDMDPTYTLMQEWMGSHNVLFEMYHGFEDENGNNLLQTYMNEIRDAENPREDGTTRPNEPTVEFRAMFPNDPRCQPVEEEKVIKYKYNAPKYLFILDDLGDSMRNKTLTNFLKMSRHYKAKVILSSQSVKDLQPSAIRQLNYIMLRMPGTNIDDFKFLFDKLELAVNFDVFMKYYERATREPFKFLYIDIRGNQFRENFRLLLSHL